LTIRAGWNAGTFCRVTGFTRAARHAGSAATGRTAPTVIDAVPTRAGHTSLAAFDADPGATLFVLGTGRFTATEDGTEAFAGRTRIWYAAGTAALAVFARIDTAPITTFFANRMAGRFAFAVPAGLTRIARLRHASIIRTDRAGILAGVPAQSKQGAGFARAIARPAPGSRFAHITPAGTIRLLARPFWLTDTARFAVIETGAGI